jgi:hypothetical protein
VGYSLPEADFELKQMLKSASLRMQDQRGKKDKRIDVVILDDLRTQQKYEGFFGADNVRCFQRGVADYLESSTN